MLKKIISLITLASIILSTIPVAFAGTGDKYVYLRVDGETVSNDESVLIRKDCFMVPVRQVSDKKAVDIIWLNDLQTAEISYNKNNYIIPVGKPFIYVNNEKTDILTPSELIGNKLYVGHDVIEKVFALAPYYNEELSILDFIDPNKVTSDDTENEYDKNKISVIACEDTWVAGGTNAEKNNGSMERLPTRYLPNNLAAYQEAYIKFDISGLSVENLNRVSFEGFICVAETGSTTIEKWLYEIDPNSWEENTLTWNNKPAKVGELIAIASGRSQKKIGVYLTDYIKKKIEAGETMISFMIEGEKTNIQTSSLASREHTNESWRPRLVFDYNSPEDYEIFDDYPIPEYGKGIAPLDNAREVIKQSTATYDYGIGNDNSYQAVESVQVVKNDKKSYCGETTMSVLFKDFRSNNITSYMKFDMTKLDASTVGGAYIQVYCTAASTTNGARKINLRSVETNDWADETITYINAPHLSNVIGSGNVSAAKTWLKIDVTDFINEKLAKNQKVFSVALDAYDNYTTKFATIYSKGYEPTLVVLGPDEVAGSKRPVFKDYSVQYDQTVTAMNPQKKTYENFKTRLLSSIKDFNAIEKTETSQFGGDLDKKYDEGTGFFRVEKIDGRWWFIDPEGYLMYSYAKCNVRPSDSIDAYKEAFNPYGGRLGWTNAQIDYYDDLGFNSFGGWSFISRQMNEEQTTFVEGLNLRQEVMDSEKMKPFGSIVPIGVGIRYAKAKKGVTGSGVETFLGGVPPVFNPDFEEKCGEIIKDYVTPWKDNPYIMGWWSDNEINEDSGMLDKALALDPQNELYAYTHAAAWEWLRERTGKKDANELDVNDQIREEFREFVFDRYHMIMRKAFKEHAPNHLYMGTRHFQPAETSPGVFKAAERYCDVISVNLYRHWTPDIVDTWAEYADKPIIITEWYARPEANVNMNALAGGFVCKTSEDCGKFYQHFALRLLEAKNVVGFHFFTAVIGEEQEQYMREFNPNVYNLIDYFDK